MASLTKVKWSICESNLNVQQYLRKLQNHVLIRCIPEIKSTVVALSSKFCGGQTTKSPVVQKWPAFALWYVLMGCTTTLAFKSF